MLAIVYGACKTVSLIIVAKLYTPEQIAGFISNENPAIHGISPEVHRQNERLVVAMGEAASKAHGSLLSVQIMGSRANGTSTPNSDVDFAAVKFDTAKITDDPFGICEAVRSVGLVPHQDGAADFEEVATVVPAKPDEFINFVDADSMALASLFEDGIFSSPDLKLARLAVTTIINTYQSAASINQVWGDIRWSHAQAYLGNLDLMVCKLAERLGSDTKTIQRVINAGLMARRHSKFGLPSDFAGYHERLRNWANLNSADLNGRPGWRLLQGVRKEL